MSTHNYSISGNTLNGIVYLPRLEETIGNSGSISKSLNMINTNDDSMDIIFDGTLDAGEITALDNIVAAHDGTPPPAKPEVEVDTDGRQIIRSAKTYKGWRYLAHYMTMTTCKLETPTDPSWDGTDSGFLSVKYYDATNTELVAGTQAELDASCVKTVLTFAPSYDIDVIGGKIFQRITPTEDINLWVIAGATDLAFVPGTVKEFVRNINLRDITSNMLKTDGRASARMNVTTDGVPVPTNKMQFIITHPVGHQHVFSSIIEYYRA